MAEAAARIDAPAVERPAILLVDDDQRNLTAISELLSDLGAEIVCVTSGMEALRKVLDQDFCAILMDVRMPDVDGYETAAIIREREKSRRIPVIFMTAYNKDETQVFQGYSAGAVDYVFKPVEPVVLRAKVSVFIELHKQADELRRKAEQERRLREENSRIVGERLDTERRLRSTEKREAMVFRSLPIAVYETEVDRGGALRTFLHGESVKRLLGFEPEDFERDPELWATRIHPDDRVDVSDMLNALADSESYSVEYRWRCADDSYRYFLDQGVVVYTEEDRKPRVFGTMFDVQDRRTLEQQLLHAQKIDAVGKLTGGIAHDFNNMLTVVIGNLDRIRRTEKLNQKTARRIDYALQGALHCRDMTKRLLGFARQQSLAPQSVDLNALIRSLADLVKRTLGERIEICHHLADDLWGVYIDPGQVEGAILNLLVNARDAMPDGGKVTISTANIERGGALPSMLDEGAYVVLDVSDTGTGMSQDVLERATEAFFTTKAAGQGTGLGLSTIHNFVCQSGGGMEIESAPGDGTSVRLYLPRQEQASRQGGAGEGSEQEADLPRARDGEVVLVVEDEVSVRRTAVNTLVELGYEVVEAGNAAVALEALSTNERIRLLFTDLIIPGEKNGYDLAQEVTRRWPDIKLLFTSAYGGDVIADSGGEAVQPFIRKPYRDYELAYGIRDAMG